MRPHALASAVLLSLIGCQQAADNSRGLGLSCDDAHGCAPGLSCSAASGVCVTASDLGAPAVVPDLSAAAPDADLPDLGPPPDLMPSPVQVHIVAPTSGQVLTDATGNPTAVFASAATSAVGASIQSVDFAVLYPGATIKLGSATAAPYTAGWVVAQWNEGTYQLKATATDSSGNSASDQISVVVKNGNSCDASASARAPSPLPYAIDAYGMVIPVLVSCSVSFTACATYPHIFPLASFKVYNGSTGVVADPGYGFSRNQGCNFELYPQSFANGSYNLVWSGYRAGQPVILGSQVVLVQNPKTIAAAISAPASGATVAETVTVAATASTSYADTIKSVDVSLAKATSTAPLVTTPVATLGSLTAAPYNLRWDTTQVPNGSYVLIATANGHMGIPASTGIPVVVNNSGAMSAVLTQKVAAGATTLSVAATTSFPGATIASVAFSANGAPLRTLTAAPYDLLWDPAQLANGSYTVNATATDSQGHTRTSNSVTLTVRNCPAVADPGAGNNTLAGAVALAGSCATVTGTIAGPGSSDYFQATVAPGRTLTLALTAPAGATFLLTGYDAAGASLGYDPARLSLTNSGAAAVTRLFSIQAVSGSGLYSVKADW